MPAGEGPDLALIHTVEVPHFANDGVLEVIDDATATAKGFRGEDYLPATWQGGTFQGKRYSLPLDVPQHILYMNVKVMKDAGLTGSDGRPRVPSSREELVTMAKRIAAKADTFGFAIGTVGPGRYTWGFHNLLWQNGANVYAPDLKKAGVADPAALEVAEFWGALDGQLKIAPPANANCRDAFIAGKLGMWIFLVTEVLLFGGLFCAYAVYRRHHPEIFIYAHQFLDKGLGALNTCVLIFSSLTMAWAVRCAQLNQRRGLIACLGITLVCAAVFLGVKYVEYEHKWERGLLWAGWFKPVAEALNRYIALRTQFLVINMFPVVMLILPLFVLMRDLGLLDTYVALIGGHATFTLPFAIWLMAAFFGSIPVELEDAARIDGCNRFETLWRIIMPISSPGLVSTGLFVFLTAWDEFFFALILILNDGVKMIFGTDGGVYPNGDNAKQFATMVQWGMTPLQAVQSATVNAAEALGRPRDVGQATPGHYGDLVGVAGDPLADVKLLQAPVFVMKGGEVVVHRLPAGR